jgi:hypothetical protein
MDAERRTEERHMSQPDQDQIAPPGTEAEMTPQADHGEESYRGCEKLTGKAAIITGGDSGIGARSRSRMPARERTC